MLQRETAHNLACDRTPHKAHFLIANARFEAILNYRKESPLKIPNRKWMPFSRITVPFTDSPHISSFPWPPWRPLVTHRSPLITSFLIYGTAIRNAPKALKT
jgi:hypothetical protein